MVWNESYSVGVKELDQQHQKIFGIINRLYEIMESPDIARELPSIIDECIEYSNYHFETEEKYFRQFDYEEAEQHVQIHDDYRRHTAEFLANYQKSSVSFSFGILDYLEKWWMDHINKLDKRYVKCFHEHGLY